MYHFMQGQICEGWEKFRKKDVYALKSYLSKVDTIQEIGSHCDIAWHIILRKKYKIIWGMIPNSPFQ